MNEEKTYQQWYAYALQWVKQAGDQLRESLDEALQVEFKTSASDLVTEKDRETEQFLVDHIRRHYPDHHVLGEEGTAGEVDYDPLQETVWVIDPIDGTTNFVHQKQGFAVSVGVYHRGIPVVGVVYDPIADECFHARRGHGAFLNDSRLERGGEGPSVEHALLGMNPVWLVNNRRSDHRKLHPLIHDVRGVRTIGAASLEIVYIACGRLDGYLTYYLAPWDFAGGYVVLKELGLRVTDAEGGELPLFDKTSFFAASPVLHEQIMQKYLL